MTEEKKDDEKKEEEKKEDTKKEEEKTEDIIIFIIPCSFCNVDSTEKMPILPIE